MNEKTKINLSDYSQPDFYINKIELFFEIEKKSTIVTSILKVKRNGKHLRDLVLDGVNLELLDLEIDGHKVSNHTITAETLTLPAINNEFELKTIVKIDPVNNLSCEGLYQSGDIFCTQNESQGFRKITYFLDRPDVMSSFTTHIKAKKKDFPLLVANGNKAQYQDAGDGYHKITWIDPHKKPAYLFALVAGDLSLVSDSFTTMSGKKVGLEIFVDHGNEDKTQHAMESLKNSMKWDEDQFGLEYDLDLYMVVAVDSFNMGAMENKGLNIFNSAYVLASDKTATDDAFQGVEAVIGHEYFHNWTGNRVTCRDWFQLTLKEGLTVFRDQEFSSDMLSRNVKRIEDVNNLRAHQYSEDGGPFSHPIKPKSYIEINNFYTATIYEKGAEVIRMIHTLIGKENFRKGMNLYFERFDGMAVTTEEFVTAMSDASGVNLDHFSVWYDQNGTPIVDITKVYDEARNELTLKINHSTKLNNEKYDSLYFPFHIGLIKKDGGEFDVENKLTINAKEQTFTFQDITENPVLSLNRGFTAPVIVNYNNTDNDLLTLMSSDSDGFVKFDASRNLIYRQILTLTKAYQKEEAGEVNLELCSALKLILNDNSLEDSYKSLFFEMPSLQQINEKLELFDTDNSYKALNTLKDIISKELAIEFEIIYNNLLDVPYSLKTTSMGARKLKGIALSYLCRSKSEASKNIAINQFQKATNMTDEISALNSLYNNFDDGSIYLDQFYNKWKSTTLVIQMWLGMQAGSTQITISKLKELEALDLYDEKVPNLVRSILGSFSRNTYVFNNVDGSGYQYLAQKIAHIDKFNPSIAARLAKAFTHKDKLDSKRKELVKVSLEFLMEQKLSNDTFEIVKTSLG